MEIESDITVMMGPDPQLFGCVSVPPRTNKIEMRLLPREGPTEENPFPMYCIALIERGDEKAAAEIIANYTERHGEPPGRVEFSDPNKLWAVMHGDCPPGSHALYGRPDAFPVGSARALEMDESE